MVIQDSGVWADEERRIASGGGGRVAGPAAVSSRVTHTRFPWRLGLQHSFCLRVAAEAPGMDSLAQARQTTSLAVACCCPLSPRGLWLLPFWARSLNAQMSCTSAIPWTAATRPRPGRWCMKWLPSACLYLSSNILYSKSSPTSTILPHVGWTAFLQMARISGPM